MVIAKRKRAMVTKLDLKDEGVKVALNCEAAKAKAPMLRERSRRRMVTRVRW
jgi:hypothetical protein